MFYKSRFRTVLGVLAISLLVVVIFNPLPYQAQGSAEDISGLAPLPASEHEDEEALTLLDPLKIPKFVEPLVIPPVMPSQGQGDWDGQGEMATEYWIAVRQFEQQILPTGFPQTTVWGYGRAGDPLPAEGVASTFNSPAFTVETRRGERVRVVWYNHLVDDPNSPRPKFLPHLLPIDQTLHWANPPHPDSHSMHASDTYLGPVPIVNHLHGGRTPPESDGYPEAWYLPAANNIPENTIMHGTHYASVHPAPQGAAVFEYPNDQPATTLWYHDHSLGITRLNVYAGMAGFWLIRDDVEDALNLPGPAPRLGDEPGTRYYEVPIAIQDRSFKEDGSLFYAPGREFFDEYTGPFVPETTVPPIWNPEFFGNTIMVNGRTWPFMEVEPRLYRLRLLNGSPSRFLVLKFDRELSFTQIGSDGGLLPDKPVVMDQLVLGPAERADVIVDFSGLKIGDKVTLLNFGPDSPFGDVPVPVEEQANPETTGQIMQFRVIELTNQGNPGVIPTSLPPIEPLTTTLPPRDVSLNEKMYEAADIPVEAMLGDAVQPLDWEDDITENPKVGDVEIWRLINLTEDAHPIHIHPVQVQILDRIPFDKEAFIEARGKFIGGGREGPQPNPMDFVTGDPMPPSENETGWKDTVIANPNMLTRIITRFELTGLYVWHCHILEHEDNEMMRPYFVQPAS